MGYQSINDMSAKEHMLWSRVDELWKCSINRDFTTIEKAIHPKYSGWDTNSLLPHDRNYAIKSISDTSVRLLDYKLIPLQVKIYENRVGIANYRYSANISDRQKNVRQIKGRWTEIFIKKNQTWLLIGVHGGQESIKVLSAVSIY